MASRSINKVVLLGNLTRDPELKNTPAGTAVCTFGLATNRSWTTTDGTTKEEAQYHRIVAWQKLADLCNKLLTKGKKVYVEGRITYRDYTTKEGQQKTVTEIVLDDFIVFYEGKKAYEDSRIRTDEKDIVSSEEEMSVEDAHVPLDGDHNEKSDEVKPEDIAF